jgi:hypothetical protein
MITIQLTRKLTMNEVDTILAWLNTYSARYEFTGEGMELLTFQAIEDATAFKLRFNV